MRDRVPPSRERGDWRIDGITDGLFRLDGGAMFGTVPKVLWNEVKPADDLNRIDLCASSLVARREGVVVLIEGGIGRRYSDKQRRIHAMDPIASLDDELARLGLAPEDVDHVVLTHLHFDHAGGLTVAGPEGRPAPHFARARHHVHAVEWEGAVRPHARSRASYVRDDWIPVHEAGLLEVHGADGPEEILPGLTLERVGGHTPGLSLVRLDGGADGDVLCVGDLVPTGAHVPVPWIMGYDLDPPRQVELKEARLPRWADEGTLVVFPHETRYPWARIARDDRGRFRPEPLDEGWLEPLRSAPWPLEP